MGGAFMNEIRSVRAKYQKELMAKANVVGVGIGQKLRRGEKRGTAIKVLVEKKLDRCFLATEDIVPEIVEGFQTDVIQVGKIRALLERTDKWRPAPGGVSIGHHLITAGTLGAVVQKNGVKMILSNNHVLANSNDGQIGDAIYQPGPYDGGTEAETIATLAEFVPISFIGGDLPGDCPISKMIAGLLNAGAWLLGSSHRLKAVKAQADGINYFDAALALPVSQNDVFPEIYEVGKVLGVLTNPHVGTPLKKSGRTTGLTTGEIVSTDTTVQVSYGGAKIAIFEDQLVAGAMSQGGDSGSLVVDDKNFAVGLLFAGSDQSTIFSPIQKVLDVFGVSF